MSDKIEALRVLADRPLKISAFIAATNHLDFEQVLSVAAEKLVIIATSPLGPEGVVLLTPAGRALLEAA